MAGFLVMLFGWNIHTPLALVIISYVFIGAGVGFAGTPASHALTDSVPVTKVGMASGTGDLQRDLGGSIMQSLLGAILSAGYAAAIAKSISAAPAATQAEITSSIGDTLKKSFGSAADLASKYPDYTQAIMDAAKQSFLDGANWAYASGIFVMLIGMFITFFFFPKKNRERELYAEYAKQSSTVH